MNGNDGWTWMYLNVFQISPRLSLKLSQMKWLGIGSSDYANFGYLFIIILSLFIYHRREATLTAYFFCSPVRISNMTFSSLARWAPIAPWRNSLGWLLTSLILMLCDVRWCRPMWFKYVSFKMVDHILSFRDQEFARIWELTFLSGEIFCSLPFKIS